MFLQMPLVYGSDADSRSGSSRCVSVLTPGQDVRVLPTHGSYRCVALRRGGPGGAGTAPRCMLPPQQRRDIQPMLFQCWAAGPALKQHWVNAACLLVRYLQPKSVSNVTHRRRRQSYVRDYPDAGTGAGQRRRRWAAAVPTSN